MTIQQLQYILEVHRTGSISKAANNLYLAQPNLSNAIRSLEQELGFPVFIRSNKGIRPTEQGFLVLEEAGQMLESYERMLSAAASAARPTPRSVKRISSFAPSTRARRSWTFLIPPSPFRTPWKSSTCPCSTLPLPLRDRRAIPKC